MKLFTSRYGNKEIARSNLISVGISLGNPRFKTAFKVEASIKELAPTRKMLYMEYDPYKELYFKMLDTIDINELEEQFKTISKGGKDVVLLCFEDLSKQGEWCHRRMFAEWWQKKTGQEVEELMPLTSQTRLAM